MDGIKRKTLADVPQALGLDKNDTIKNVFAVLEVEGNDTIYRMASLTNGIDGITRVIFGIVSNLEVIQDDVLRLATIVTLIKRLTAEKTKIETQLSKEVKDGIS